MSTPAPYTPGVTVTMDLGTAQVAVAALRMAQRMHGRGRHSDQCRILADQIQERIRLEEQATEPTT